MSNTESLISFASEYSQFWTTILGAIVAGGIALLGQIMVLKENRKLLDRRRSETRLGLGQSLLIKMMKINGTACLMDEHFNSADSRDLEKNGIKHPWQAIEPLVGLEPSISFTSDELGMLLNLKDDDVFNSIVTIDDALCTIIDLAYRYEKEREILLNIME